MSPDDIRRAVSTWSADCGAAVGLDADGACDLPFGDGSVLHLQLREDAAELDLVAPLGEVPEDVRAAVFEALLAANYYWRETFGATLSWQTDLQQAVLAYPLRFRDLDEPTFASALDEFVTLAETWRKRLARDVAEAEEDLVEAEAEESDEDATPENDLFRIEG